MNTEENLNSIFYKVPLRFVGLLFLLFCSEGQAQNSKSLDSLELSLHSQKVDSSRIRILQKLAIGYVDKNPTKSFRFSEEARLLSQKSGNRKSSISSLQLMARALRSDGKDSMAIIVAERSLALSKELGDLQEISECYGILNRVYEKTQPQKCIPILKEKLTVDQRIKDPEKISTDYLNLGNKERLQSKNDVALEYFTLGYETLINAGLGNQSSRLLQGMAGQNYIMNNYETAVSMLKRAMILNRERNEWTALGENYNLMGVVYRRKGPVDSAIYWYKQSIELFTRRNEIAGLPHPLNNLGNIYQDLKQFNKAIEYRRKAMSIYIEIGQKNQIGSALTSLSQTYLDMNQWDRALQTIDSAYNFNRAIGQEWESRRLLFQTKSKVYEHFGMLDSSLIYFKKYINIRDSIYGKESSDKMVKLMLQFETKQKEDQITLLKKDNQLMDQLGEKQALLLENASLEHSKSESEMELLTKNIALEKSISKQKNWDLEFQRLRWQVSESKNTRLKERQELLEKERQLKQSEIDQVSLQKNLLVIGSVLLVAVAVLIVFRIRIRNQKLRIQTLTRIGRDLHDNIGSTLGSITVYSEMAKTLKNSKPEKLDEILIKIEENSRESVDMMADIVWSLNPANESIEKLMMRLKNYATDILVPKGFNISFELDEKIESQKTSLAQRTNLFLIGKEALFNASKYSNGTVVSVSCIKTNNRIRLSIEDNGKGFSETDRLNSRNGNGILNMKIRADEINANLKIDSKPGNGTRVILDLT